MFVVRIILQFYILVSISSHKELDHQSMEEVKYVHQLIKDNGQQGDYAIQIQFGELIPVSINNSASEYVSFSFRSFKIFGTGQVNKLIEILEKARNHGYINYNVNDRLKQEQDEEVYIRLIKTPY